MKNPESFTLRNCDLLGLLGDHSKVVPIHPQFVVSQKPSKHPKQCAFRLRSPATLTCAFSVHQGAGGYGLLARCYSTLIWSGLFTTISVECPEDLDLGLLAEQTCYTSALKSWCLNARKEVPSGHCRACGKRYAEETRTDAYPCCRHFGSHLCGSGIPFPEKHRWSLPGVNPYSSRSAGWARENRNDRRRVRNARHGQQIVIYTHSGTWWVQLWPPYLGS
jgi:hypothetical protein